MSVSLSVPSFSLFSFILRFFFISFCLYLSFYAVVFLVIQYKWKANGQRKKKKNRLHCFPAHLTYKKDAKRRSNLRITQEDDTNEEVKWTRALFSSVFLLLLCSFVFDVVVRTGYRTTAPGCTPPLISFLIHQQQEIRRKEEQGNRRNERGKR